MDCQVNLLLIILTTWFLIGFLSAIPFYLKYKSAQFNKITYIVLTIIFMMCGIGSILFILLDNSDLFCVEW